MIRYQWLGEATDLDELWGFYEKYWKETKGDMVSSPQKEALSFAKWYYLMYQEGKANLIPDQIITQEEYVKRRLQTMRAKAKDHLVTKFQRSLPKKTKAREKTALTDVYAKSDELRQSVEEVLKKDPGYTSFTNPAYAEEKYKQYVKELQEAKQKQLRKELTNYEDRVLAEKRMAKVESLHLAYLLVKYHEPIVQSLQADFDRALKTRDDLEVLMLDESTSSHGYWNDYYQRTEPLSSENIRYFVGDFEDDSERAIANVVSNEEYLTEYIQAYLMEHEPSLKKGKFDEKEMELIDDFFVNGCEELIYQIFEELRHSRVYVISLLIENPRYSHMAKVYSQRHVRKYKKQLEEDEARYKEQLEKAERAKRLRENIVKSMPSQYIDLYPLARSMKRHFVLHIGPTNSGKTYSAMQALRELKSTHSREDKEGIYLAPLRLLAYEQFEALNHDGYLCHLVTGEEKIMIPFANLQASTVEMADLKKPYEVAVIDEAQMIGDRDRGGAWTAAILGLYCKEIHVCAAPEAEALIVKLIESCEDSYEIIYHKRQTALQVQRNRYVFPDSIKIHDALIVFSRKNVHAVASELQSRGIKCSIIYGNLPYDVRQEEARKFMNGDTQVLVATDAIGMGMNLPVERIVFLEMMKFDGVRKRLLESGEVKQIAGRAGRRGIYEIGYVATCENTKTLARAMEEETEVVEKARIHFPESLLGIEGKLSEVLERWISLPDQELFEKSDAKEMLLLCRELEHHSNDKKLIYEFLTIPTDYSSSELKNIWLNLFMNEIKEQGGYFREYLPEVFGSGNAAQLQQLELQYRICDLLHSYMEHCHPEIDHSEIMSVKKEISGAIMKILSKQRLTTKTCKICGRVLPWNYMYGTCEDCHRRH